MSMPIFSPIASRAIPMVAKPWWLPGSASDPGSGLVALAFFFLLAALSDDWSSVEAAAAAPLVDAEDEAAEEVELAEVVSVFSSVSELA